MKRIAGTLVMLAAFSGCTQQQRYTLGDRPPTATAEAPSGSSWQRSNVQLPPDPPPPQETMANGVSSGYAQSPVQTAAKPSQAMLPPGVPPVSTPMPTVSEPNAQTVPASYSVDPALQGMPTVTSQKAPAMELTPPQIPEIAVSKPLPTMEVEATRPVSIALSDSKPVFGSPALRLVNTRHFSLSYAVQDAGSSACLIDLWETRDGKMWKKCDVVAQEGAYVVEVKEDGVFGYAMAAHMAGDKSDTRPHAGDVPQVWVTVDTVKPAVALTGVELNLTSRMPELIVRWSARDRNFGPRPITLSYAEQAEGPWLPLAANIDNTGHYECAIPANMPKRALLRVEAVDLVGNSGMAMTDRSVRLDFNAAPVSLLPTPPQAMVAPVEQSRPLVVIYSVDPSGKE